MTEIVPPRFDWRHVLKQVEHNLGDERDSDWHETTLCNLYRTSSSTTFGPARPYHNLSHVERTLGWSEELQRRAGVHAPEPDALALAILYHDAIYAPGRSGNEEASAQLLLSTWRPHPLVDRAAELIIITRDHQPSSSKWDEVLIADADLFELGYEGNFRTNSNRIRRECPPNVGFDEYRTARIKWITEFLSRDRIFHSLWAWENLESKARSNLRSELDDLLHQTTA